MIPTDNDANLFDFEVKKQPSKTYALNDDRVGGICNNLDSVKQAIYLILNTERYKYPIYSWDYGVELQDLYGERKSYVIPELERRIKEALLQDDRIESVDEFTFKSSKDKILVNFIVHTIYGNIDVDKAVNI
ncbi:DUF2634 domain-containing protein [Clostridium sp. CCUG 7971]|uniref:DUF2634 domain-containing protein n=1 Tax=Clostridium sp. CCUG 7971 TaxID=2811414 RepID=UPI001ABA4D40|nr:DUF2634 domain-containing protein [Clostridium sp. CCUG 7971]MBO3444009.1 DUF2634 domain-containing protein [Clostridium sp. CCUG 7971]